MKNFMETVDKLTVYLKEVDAALCQGDSGKPLSDDDIRESALTIVTDWGLASKSFEDATETCRFYGYIQRQAVQIVKIVKGES